MSAVVIRETIRFQFINLNFRDHGQSMSILYTLPPLSKTHAPNNKHRILSAMDVESISRWSMRISPFFMSLSLDFQVVKSRRVTVENPSDACELGSLLSDEFLQGGGRHTLLPGKNPRGNTERPRSKWRVSTITGWWFEPLWKILVNWDDYSQYTGK